MLIRDRFGYFYDVPDERFRGWVAPGLGEIAYDGFGNPLGFPALAALLPLAAKFLPMAASLLPGLTSSAPPPAPPPAPVPAPVALTSSCHRSAASDRYSRAGCGNAGRSAGDDATRASPSAGKGCTDGGAAAPGTIKKWSASLSK
jgi:hypothetical protein